MKNIAVFSEFEGVYELFLLEMLKEVDDKLPSAKFKHSVNVFKAALVENIVESDDGNHLLRMSDDFENAPENVGFNSDVHNGVLLTRNVEEFGIARKNLLVFDVKGDLPKRRNTVEVDESGVFSGFFAVDRNFSDALTGKNVGDSSESLAAIEFEIFADVGHVDADLSTHELIDSGDDSGTLVFAGISVEVADFAGDRTVDDGVGGVAIALEHFANARAKNGEVELVERLGESETVEIVDSDNKGGENVTETPMFFLFGDIKDFLVFDSLLVIVLGEVEELF